MFALPILNSYKTKFYAIVSLIVMVLHFPISSSESVEFTKCGDTGSGAKNTCDIKNVSMHPCPEAVDNETCNAYRGSNMTIQFEWYPPFSANDFQSQVFSSNLVVDIPDIDHDKPGCQYSKCPIVAGEKHIFKAVRFIKPIYPPGSYLVKYKLSHESSEKQCCFLVRVNVV